MIARLIPSMASDCHAIRFEDLMIAAAVGWEFQLPGYLHPRSVLLLISGSTTHNVFFLPEDCISCFLVYWKVIQPGPLNSSALISSVDGRLEFSAALQLAPLLLLKPRLYPTRLISL